MSDSYGDTLSAYGDTLSAYDAASSDDAAHTPNHPPPPPPCEISGAGAGMSAEQATAAMHAWLSDRGIGFITDLDKLCPGLAALFEKAEHAPETWVSDLEGMSGDELHDLVEAVCPPPPPVTVPDLVKTWLTDKGMEHYTKDLISAFSKAGFPEVRS